MNTTEYALGKIVWVRTSETPEDHPDHCEYSQEEIAPGVLVHTYDDGARGHWTVANGPSVYQPKGGLIWLGEWGGPHADDENYEAFSVVAGPFPDWHSAIAAYKVIVA